MGEVLVLHLFTKCFEIIDKHLEPMEHLQHTLIIFHLEASKLLLENIGLGSLHHLSALKRFL
jgi:hypothetical protein